MDTREDARLCWEHGIDGIIVSNHGGRAPETLRATIEALPEVVAEVNGRIPVFLDRGVRRGTDVFKALALGRRATAVGIGRPLLWGLGAFGQAVDRVLEILQGELKPVMGNCGTRTVADITRDDVANREGRVRAACDASALRAQESPPRECSIVLRRVHRGVGRRQKTE
ncbi:MAG: alpha-hydroxy acid oxidase [Candidatus Acidiferrales bacterium]